MKQIAFFMLISCIFYGSMSFFCCSKTKGFSLNKISWSSLPCNHVFTEDLEKLDPQILKQNFYYFKSGGQSCVFISEDGHYIIKFFKNYLAWPKSIFTSKKRKEKLLCKTDRDFYSYRLAFEELKEESGMLYLHLNKTNYKLPAINLIDKLGITYHIQLDNHPFLLQKKAELIYCHLDKLLQKKSLEKAKEALSNLLQLLSKRLSKGIFDEDAKIHRNCGFIDDQAIFIDVGRFRRSAQTQTLTTMTERLKTWLHEYYPQLEAYLKQEIHAIENN